MKAEQLISQVAAIHGVDLMQLSRTAEKARRKSGESIDRTRNGVRSTILLDPLKRRVITYKAHGTGTRSLARPEWTLAELGQAAINVDATEFMAACFAFAGSDQYFWRLHEKLSFEATKLQLREGWPDLVRDLHGIEVPYTKHLAKLVLDEDRNCYSIQFASHCDLIYSTHQRVTEKIWERELQPKFAALQLVWMQWLGTAASLIQEQLSRD